MLIIYGRRAYGRVDAHGGEYAHTTFAHLWYMPLFPIQSYWITQEGDAPLGFEIGFHGRSVMTAYLRMWAPLVAIACLASGSPIIGAAFAALGVGAWLWRPAPLARRSDFNFVAYGTRCEPSRMPRDMRDRVKRSLEGRWEDLALGKPPEDIAQFGAKTIDEAATAYGLLRLSAVERRDPNGHNLADRIAAGQYDKAPAGEGPYREDTHDAPASAVLAQVEALAAAAKQPTRPAQPWWAYTRSKAFLVTILALAGIGGLVEEGPSLQGAPLVDAAALQTIGDPSTKDFVRVECDSIQRLGTFSEDSFGYACAMGGHTLAVVSSSEHAEGTGTTTFLTGTLVDMSSPLASESWPSQIRHDAEVFPLYLTEASLCGHQAAAVACIVGEVLLGGIVGFWLALRLRRRRR
ncbi:MAG: hypothetical protein ABI678_15515 [Kofleriaceae bacterium]